MVPAGLSCSRASMALGVLVLVLKLGSFLAGLDGLKASSSSRDPMTLFLAFRPPLPGALFLLLWGKKSW